MSRQHNFSAGPAVLPPSVIEELKNALLEFRDCNAGLMEISHRSAGFSEVIQSAENRLRNLISIPDDYHVLFLQGGASLQFYMLPLNLLTPEETGAYLMTGTWSTKALKEAKRCSQSQSIWEDSTNQSVPKNSEYSIPKEATYLHYTSNNTIYGTQYSERPSTNIPLVVDMSSDICSRKIDVQKYDVIYAGAQKNLGPSGVTAIILSPWAVEKSNEVNRKRPGGLPSMLNYGLMVEKNSMFNTPNTFGIFALDRMLAWLENAGGVESIEKINQQKASLIYQELDSSDFWIPHAKTNSRSLMNITWRIARPELEATFIEEARKEGLLALKGHRSVGGIRSSLYNACPLESAVALRDFMVLFRERHGHSL
ncbi:MAG: 3-phosphoserine/phosphohydroxythreonine transaminase [Myxococcota bacterium]|nr:3-phosphoserine/phosphohydroxythreonine transaminase [Myxococcota bacterium]